MVPCALLQVKQYLASHWLLVDKLTPVIQVNLDRVEVSIILYGYVFGFNPKYQLPEDSIQFNNYNFL